MTGSSCKFKKVITPILTDDFVAFEAKDKSVLETKRSQKRSSRMLLWDLINQGAILKQNPCQKPEGKKIGGR